MNIVENIEQNNGNIIQLSVDRLKVTPADVEFKATKSYGAISAFIIFSAILSIIPIGKFIHIFIKNTNIDLFITTIITVLIMLSLLEFTNYIMQKIPIGNVRYKDMQVTIDGATYTFYKDIWDIEYSKNIINIFFNSATLVFYIISPHSKTPISYRIKFDQDARAKYIFDLFHSKMRE